MSRLTRTLGLKGIISLLSRLRASIASYSVREFFLSSVDFGTRRSLPSVLETLILIRVGVLSLILGTCIVNGIGEPSFFSDQRLIFGIIAITYAISLLNTFLLRQAFSMFWLGYGQLVTDVVLASLAIYATGSLVMISLYLSIIVAAAFVFGRFGAVIVAAISGLCYAILTTGGTSALSGHELPNSAVDILGVYGSLVLVALASAYVAKQLERAGAVIASHRRDLQNYSARERQLVDGLAEGVITLDLSSTITGINEAARAILGLAQFLPEQFVGHGVKEAFSNTGAGQLLSAIQEESVPGRTRCEISFTRPSDETDIRLSYSVGTLSDSSGTVSGKVLRFMDVSHIHDIEEQLDLHERMTQLLADTQVDIGLHGFGSGADNMIGSSTAMHSVFSLVERVAKSDASVLVSGESGTGKELIARSIHRRSRRNKRPFVAINCGAIPETLIESELFGHKKGSFTGAVVDKTGLFQEANGGTIFLDEIGELPLHLQSKLLRVLQERCLRPIGEVRDIPVDVRVLAASNRDLHKEVEEGRFRDDLYYRLNVVEIVVPPLRDRRDDIPLLVKHFFQRTVEEGAPLPQISPEALQILNCYDFPGNVRELENLLERALVLGGSAILPIHLPEGVRQYSEKRRGQSSEDGANQSNCETKILSLPIDLEAELAKLEQLYLNTALGQSAGVKKNAAKLLGLNFRSFRYRLKKYGLGDSGLD